MQENRWKYNIIIIGIVAIAILVIYQNAKLKEEISALRDDISTARSDMNILSSSISDRVEWLLNEQNNLVTDFSLNYTDIDTETKSIKALAKFTLKQADSGSRVYLNATDENNTVATDFECISENGLNYTCELTLPYKYNYIFNVYQESADRSRKKLNTDFYSGNMKDDYENRVRMVESGTESGTEGTNYSVVISNMTFGQSALKIKSVVIKAFYEEKEVFSKDVTDFNIANAQTINRINVMLASGDTNISSAIPEAEYGPTFVDEKGIETGSYMINIPHAATGVPVEKNNYPKYSFKVIVTNYNGDVFEL